MAKSSGGEECRNDELPDADDERCKLWFKFKGKPPIPGFASNQVAMFRTFQADPEDAYPLPGDVIMEEELSLSSEVCKYLLLNKVENIQVVTNLSLYPSSVTTDKRSSQGVEIKLVPEQQSKRLRDSTDVTVVVLHACRGQWWQRMLFEVTRDAYLASRLGVIILGNAAVTEGIKEPNWAGYLSYLQNQGGGFMDHLEIMCEQHRVINRSIFCAVDLKKCCALGGCSDSCGEGEGNENGNHLVEVEVTPGESVEQETAKAKEQEHCSQESALVKVTKQLPCGHSVKTTRAVDWTNYKCREMLGMTLPCGHIVIYLCGEDITDFDCTACWRKKLCEVKLKCGHLCGTMACGADPSHDNVKCEHPCEKMCARGMHPCPRQGQHPCGEPCEPCTVQVLHPLRCGHGLVLPCSEKGPDLKTYFCTKKCNVEFAFCKHTCPKYCGEECGPCEVLVEVALPKCRRGHTVMVKCQQKRPKRCTRKVSPRVKPACGHDVQVECHQADKITKEDLANICEFWCRAVFDQDKDCGHRCVGNCRNCFQDRFHMRCQTPCDKILICGHTCASPCGMACPPCRSPCFNRCEHMECKYECGVPCDRNCQEPCPYACPHSKCSKKCFEVCDKQVCSEPCPEILSCGHPCTGFCGEKCPPFCRVCQPEKLAAGTFSGDSELDPEARFIYLQDCGHCIESNAMESWINVKSDEILPLRCPVCRARISWIRRFSAVMDENYKLVNSVRKKLFGDLEEIESVLGEMQTKLDAHVEASKKRLFIPEYEDHISEELNLPRFRCPHPEERFFYSMSLDRAKFLSWICNEWIHAGEAISELKDEIPRRYLQRFEEYWELYLVDMAESRVWPMHPNELRALSKERIRLNDFYRLYSRWAWLEREEMMANGEASREFRWAEDVLRRIKPYTLDMRREFSRHLSELDAVLQCTIKLTDEEREEIVSAFGEGSGRWFKCPNGHVYVVTECGGVTERGNCNECGAIIGGEDHMVMEGNYLASEMDGARLPLYPTALNRMNQND